MADYETDMKLQTKSFLSKMNFAMGNKPRLLPYPKVISDSFIPSPYKAVFTVSCDCELAWGWRFSKQLNCDLERAKEIARKERGNILLALELSEKFGIPLTWAFVGHLFLKGCTRIGGVAHSDMPRVKYFNNEYWRFKEGDWFGDDPCCDWQKALEWYAPDLTEKVINSKVRQEIACHTFSHIDCREGVCTEDVFRKELRKCKEAISSYGIKLESLVFPGNFIGNLKVLKEEGFTSYRIDRDVLGFPTKGRYGLWEFPTTAVIGPSSYNWDLGYYVRKYRTMVERAIRYRRLCHFWFHPSSDTNFLKTVLVDLFEFIKTKRHELHVTNMKEYIALLEKECYEKRS